MAKQPSKVSDTVETPKVADDAIPSPIPDKTGDTGDAAANLAPPPPLKPMGWVEALRKNDQKAFTADVETKVKDIIAKHSTLKNYEVLFLFDDDPIVSYHSDRLYAAASKFKGSGKDILLITHSPGGQVEPAYLISKTLKRIAANPFAVAVPRRAKSAATLLALGADQIHMGMISQLGPIDPQVQGLPALALGNALNHVADIACKFPGASEMLTKYLIHQAPLQILGYYERVSESAAQYAERLLTGKILPPERDAASVAKHLVHH